MRRQEISDFLVETNGECFICARNVLNEWSSNELASPGSYTSVYRLSQYLKMDMSNVFHEKESIPSELLDSVKRSRLKVPLCEQCTKWNEKVSGLCLQLERIETEVSFYLELFHGSLLSLDKDDTTDLRYKLNEDGANSNGELLEKKRIVKALRTETRQKCSQRLKSAQPIVKVQNMTANQISSKQQKIKSHADNDKNEGSDIDGNEYVDDTGEFAEDPIREDESDDDPLHIPTSHQSHVYFQTDEPASEPDNNVHPSSMSGLNSLLSATILSSRNSDTKNEKLTFVINPETGKFKCSVCPVEFTERCSLKRHYGSIHLKTKHMCTTCGKEFTSKSDCTRHYKNAHVGIRFKCNLCGGCFAQKYTLIEHHGSVHLGKRFQCKFCEKSFARKSNLTAHLRLSHPQQ